VARMLRTVASSRTERVCGANSNETASANRKQTKGNTTNAAPCESTLVAVAAKSSTIVRTATRMRRIFTDDDLSQS